MPTYEYACKDCGANLEVVQSFKDASLTECPTCGGSLRKVFSAAGLIFKGSGWHVKDYASSRPTSGAIAPASGSAASDATAGDGKGGASGGPASTAGEGGSSPGPAVAASPSPAPSTSGPTG